MGEIVGPLLVARARIGVLAGLALLAACRATPEPVVDAERYDAFWLWAGVRPQPVLARAKTLYLLEGEVTARDPARLTLLRSGVPRLPGRDLWLVIRVETLRWGAGIYGAAFDRLAAWRRAGNRVIGVQIDFDARTRHLDDYAAFLADLRRRLPPGTQLGVTGLLDWSANGDPAQLARLGGVVDEVVLQTYQGRQTIPGYQAYLDRLGTFAIPFRIGIVQGGRWREPAGLAHHPMYRGTVVFLVNPPGADDAGRALRH